MDEGTGTTGEEIFRLRTALAAATAREQALQESVARLETELAVLRSPVAEIPGLAHRLVRRARRSGLLPVGAPPPPPASGAESDLTAKQRLRARTDAELDGLLHGTGRLAIPAAAAPAVSILLVLYNQAGLTHACLRSIAAVTDVALEVIIVDNASADQTGALLDRLDGPRIIRNAENRHFLLASNQAAAAARGDAILLLNNDAVLRPGALAAALGALAADPGVGAVGGMIVLPDGTLQEAGSIIWREGSCLGYGRGRFPTEAEFQFVRDVDYCSGAFLLVRRALFEALGGFDTAFAPAYYEETDFCMRLREAGHRILYHPLATIDHYEFASSTSTEAALALQRRNHQLFADRHRATLLTEHQPPGTPPLEARMRGAFKGRVLVIEDRVPFPAMGAGYPRASALLHGLVAEGWFVTLYPLLFPEGQWDSVYAAFPRQIEIMLGAGEDGLAGFLKARAGYYDTIIVSRPHNMRIFLDKGGAGAGGRLIYDAEAVFATREFFRLALAGTPVSPARQKAQLRQEMALAQAADRVITVSAREGATFTAAGITDLKILGHALVAQPTPAAATARRDILFVGALDDDPSPNTDSLLWFVEEIMPLLDGLAGDDWRLLVAGRAGAPRVRRLAGPRVRILGRVEELAPLYGQVRLLIAPTRFAGGIPHKVHEAAAHGVPVVVTPLLAEQLDWTDGAELLVGGTPEAFAGACARLMREAGLWQDIRDRALARLADDCDPAAFRAALGAIMERSGAAKPRAAPRRAAATPAPYSRHLYRAIMLARRLRGVGAFLRTNGVGTTLARVGVEIRLRTGRRDYATWIRLYDQLRVSDRRAIAARIELLATHPVFSLLLPLDPGTQVAAAAATLAALKAQFLGSWQLCIADRSGAADIAAWLAGVVADPRIRVAEGATGDDLLAAATGDFVIQLRPGDVLREQTLFVLATEHDVDPDLVVLYTDGDRLDAAGARTAPWFATDFSPEMLFDPAAFDGGLMAVKRAAAVAAGGFAGRGVHDLLVRVLERLDPLDIRHIPGIQLHRAAPVPPDPDDVAIVADHVARLGLAAAVVAEPASGRPRVVLHLPDPAPLVTVIVPTRDRMQLLRRCMQGLMAETEYPALEIIVVDNASREPPTLRLFERLGRDPRVRILPFPYAFNYAAMNNRAVDAAQGEVVVLLNNDIAVREPGWLREMVAQALRPEVGAVGAKLLYGNGTIQHAGVATGIFTVAGHPFRGRPAEDGGHHGSLHRVQPLSAVTAACMAVRRGVYQEVGGFDEVNLTVSYNDVDFCLRLRERGYRILWTPHAVLDHLESVSRGQDTSPENVERAKREAAFMTRKWGAVLGHDPFYNPNLTKGAEDYGLAFPPRVAPSWQQEV